MKCYFIIFSIASVGSSSSSLKKYLSILNIQQQIGMNEQIGDEFCHIPIKMFFELAYDCKISVVGAIKQIFQHKRYIVEVYIGQKLVIRSMKRYSQFQALHQVIRMNFKNIDIGLSEFPSKFQVVNREETRRHYFQTFLSRIIEIYCEKTTNQTNRRLLSTIYVFMGGDKVKQTKKSNYSEKESVRSSPHSSKNGQRQFEQAFKMQEFEGEIKKAAQNRRKVESIGVKSVQSKQKNKFSIQSYETKLREFFSTQFLIKFEGQQEWKERFLKIQSSCLLIYKHKNDNHFKTKIQLYQAEIDYHHRNKNLFDHFCQKMQLDNEPTFTKDFSTLAVSHEYDYKKLLIRAKDSGSMGLTLARQILLKASHQAANCLAIQGVFSPIGKIFIVFHKLIVQSTNKKVSPIVFIRINAAGMIYQTKRMNVSNSSAITIKQGFIMYLIILFSPISNAFANIFIEVIANQNEGIISHGSEQKCVGTYRICFSDFISYPSGYGLEKLHARPQQENSVNQKYQSLIELSIINYSHFSSNYADSFSNENDGNIMKGLKSTQDTDLLVITVDRVLRIIGNIALFITAFWRNIYLFKYPRMGYTFFVFMLLMFLFGTAGRVFEVLISLILFAMVYNIPVLKKIIHHYLQQFVYNYRHESHKQPLCLNSNELKFYKWIQNLQMMKRDYKMLANGRLEKNQQAKNKKFQYWQFQIHDKTFKIKEQLPGLIEKVFQVKKIIELVLRMINAVINTLEKFCNIFSWADPRRSIFIFAALILISYVANIYLIRGIGTVFCIHRLVKGRNFYALKHYKNNRKMAIFSLRYIINKSFTELLPQKGKKIETTDQNQIIEILSEIFFPVREENAVKKLRQEIESILGVYIQPEELAKREQRKNQMRLYYLIEIIESCQARLKLEWISGLEGISEGFQELKQLTKEQLVIDLWVESLLINFIWNIPSQLYTTFRPIRTTNTLKCEKKGQLISESFTKLSY